MHRGSAASGLSRMAGGGSVESGLNELAGSAHLPGTTSVTAINRVGALVEEEGGMKQGTDGGGAGGDHAHKTVTVPQLEGAPMTQSTICEPASARLPE